MASLNQCQFIGHLGQEPKIAYTADGKAVAKISIACSESWQNKSGQKQEKTEWIPVSIFGKLAEIAQQYLHKGSKVFVQGKYTTRKWQNKEGKDQWTTEVVLSGFGSVLQMLDSKGEGQPKQEFVPQVHDPIEPVATDGFEDSEIPFQAIMGDNRKQKVYTLTDGTQITPSELGVKLKMSTPSARCRLEKYTEPVAVFRSVGATKSKRVYKNKQYTLDDGTVTDAYKVSSAVGITLRNARSRLSLSNEAEKVFGPKQDRTDNNPSSFKIRAIMEREASMYNDMFVLAFKTI